MNFALLSTPDSNPKTDLSTVLGYYNPILHLAPHREAGLHSVCPASTEHCREFCLYKCGHGGIPNKKYGINHVQRCRINKTRMFIVDREHFMQELNIDIRVAKDRAKKKGLKLAVRLNGTSDIAFENIPIHDPYRNKLFNSIMECHSDVQFYDYTKIFHRLRKDLPENYHLMFSYSGENITECKKALKKGFNGSVIFRGKKPKMLWGYRVIDGDEHDLRFLDPYVCVIGLKAKGALKKSKSKFAMEV